MESSLLIKVALPVSLFIIMLGMGLSLVLADFKRVSQRPKAATIGILCQMLCLPILGFGVATAFNLGPELAVGLMILTLCPGGTTSNLFTYLFKGDTALSITLTAIVSLIAPFSVPIVGAMTMNHFMGEAQTIEFPIGKTVLQLMVITVVPVFFGMLINHFKPAFAKKCEQPIKIFSFVFLIFIVLLIIIKEWSNMGTYFLQTGMAMLTLNILAMLFGFFIARASKLTRIQSVTIGFEVGIQNGTTALLVTGTILGNLTMTIPSATYSLLMFATGTIFGFMVKGWLANEPATDPQELKAQES